MKNMTTYFVIGLAIVIGLFFFINKSNESSKLTNPIDNVSLTKKAVISVDTTLDSPVGFGYKIMWIAAKTDNKERFAEILELKNIQKSNWKTGIDNAYEKGVFITPNIGAWTLAVGMGLPTGDSKESIEKVSILLKKLSQEFGEAQFFCTHRVVEYHCWIKSTKGQIDRVYSYLGEKGENIVVEGKPTEIEGKHKLINTLSPESKQVGYFDRTDLEYPNESLVMNIAENWSVNPSTLEDRLDIKGLGIIGK